MAIDPKFWMGIVACIGIVVLGGCANSTLAAQGSITDPAPSRGVQFTAPVSSPGFIGSGSIGSGSAGPTHTVTVTTSPSSLPPSPTLTGRTIASSSVHLTATDSGQMITVRVGTRIYLDLAPNVGSYDPPSVDKPTVLREDTHAGGYPATTTATAQFTAIAPGTARITSQTDLACLHTTPACLPPQREFTLTVSVR